MKIKCVILKDVNGTPVEFSHWLKIGKIYNVLTVYIEFNGKKNYRILQVIRNYLSIPWVYSRRIYFR